MTKRTRKREEPPRLRCSKRETAMPVALIGVALGARMKLERTSQEDGKSNGLAHERAQRRLDEVRSRYGIHLADSSARPIADIPANSLKKPAKLKLGYAPSIPKTRPKPTNGKEFGLFLKPREGRVASGFPSDECSFHFLVRSQSAHQPCIVRLRPITLQPPGSNSSESQTWLSGGNC